jgi:antitoxin ParD1/3/4
MVNEKVESGLYNSASEVIREGLRLLKEQDDLKRIRQEELRREVLKGYEQSQRGESRPLDVKAIKAKLDFIHLGCMAQRLCQALQ